jgi:PAS domain S-box-containing protein
MIEDRTEREGTAAWDRPFVGLHPGDVSPATLDGDLQRDLFDRLLGAPVAQVIAPIGVVVLSALLLLGDASTAGLIVWACAVALATAARLWIPRHVRRTGMVGDRALLAFRGGVVASAVAWAAGPVLLLRSAPLDDLAIVAMVFSGIVAAATATLVADRTSFRLFTVLVLAPLSATILSRGLDRDHVLTALLVALFGVVADVVHRHSFEQLVDLLRTSRGRRHAENELREHEARYRMLVESMSDLVWQADANGRWTFLNEACHEIYGETPDRLLGRSMTDASAPERRDDDINRFRMLLAGESMLDCETEHIRSDGTRVHLAFSGRPVRDAEGRVAGAQGTARDVTVRARIHAELARARQEAERTAAARSGFVANVSHEIRTPMNGIIGITDLLLDQEMAVEHRRSVELIRTSAEALLTVINDILDFSRIEAGRVSIDEEAFDLHGLVDSSVRLHAGRAREKAIELRYEIAPDVPRTAVSDPSRVRQILNNLIGNAVKFTDHGSVCVVVRREDRDGAGMRLVLRVRDTGIGIDDDKIGTIFEEFSQVDMTTTRRFGGTGLGLAIARRLARALDGDLTVMSEPGVGSEFVATIVVREAPAAADGGFRASIDLAGRRILVVDDNPTNRRVFRDMLRAAGTHVAVARSAASGMRMLRRTFASGRPADAVLVDSQMPEQDGFDFGTQVRADRAYDDVQLVMLTSGGLPGDGQRCRELGFDGYLTKPFSRSELLEAIVAVLAAPGQRGTRLITRHSIEETRRRIRILLVEDNPVNREVAATMLRRRGHDVDIAENGREAVDAVAALPYDLVLMDIQMPVLDGLAATREIREMTGRSGIRIVALTAHALAEEKQRCLASGMDGYLSKPFRPHELFAIIEGWGATSAVDQPGDGPAPPIDIAAFHAQLREAGIEDALGALLETFAGDAPARLAAIEKACLEGDAAAIASSAHAFKSAAGAVSAKPLAELLQRTEMAGREGNVTEARAIAPSIRPAATAVLDLIAGLRAEVGV